MLFSDTAATLYAPKTTGIINEQYIHFQPHIDMKKFRPLLHVRLLSARLHSTNIMAPYLEDRVEHDTSMGDLNNVSSMRAFEKPKRNPEYAYKSLAIPDRSEDAEFRKRYRPFLLDDNIQDTDWVSQLELATVTKMVEEDIQKTGQRLRVLVLYGSLRQR